MIYAANNDIPKPTKVVNIPPTKDTAPTPPTAPATVPVGPRAAPTFSKFPPQVTMVAPTAITSSEAAPALMALSWSKFSS